MSDGSVHIDTKIDDTGLDKGLKKVKTLLDDAAKYYASLGKEGADAFKKISDQLKSVDAAAAISGDKIGAIARKKKILQTAIESLIANGLKPEDLKVKSLQKAYDELSAIQAKNESGTGKLKKSMKALGGAALAAAAALKKGMEQVNKLTEVYRAQIQAEKQLEQAARNNPFLNNAAVDSLKEYASQLQAVTTFGDEELIGFMAQLSAAGRTQSEIEKIMAASVDIAASGTMSLESAVRNLNKTFGGLSGELGETIPEIKALTEAELKNGAAVDLMAARYKGMAAEVAVAAGGAKQLAALKGDFLEAVGSMTAPTTRLWEAFWTKVYQMGIEAIQKIHKELGLLGAGMQLEKNVEIASSEYVNEVTGMVSKGAKFMNDFTLESTRELLERKRALTSAEMEALINIKREMNDRKRIADQKAKEHEAEMKRLKAEEDKKAKTAATVDHLKQVTEAREKAIQAIKLQAEAEGKEVDQQDLINAYIQSYIALIAESNGKISQTDKVAQDLLGTIQEMLYVHENTLAVQAESKRLTEEQKKAEAERLEEAKKAREELEKALDEITDGRSTSQLLQAQLDELDELYNAVEDGEELRYEIEQEYAEKRKKLEEQVTEAKKAEQLEQNIALLEIANQFAAQYQEIMDSMQQLATSHIENDAAVKVAAVEKQYEAGEISAEEYEAKLSEINKKAAQEKYKVDMWAWSASILSAIANTAVGAAKALAEGGAFTGPALAAMIAAAGGIQLASIIAAKPIPPSFTTGGIVPGTAYTGDRVTALLNSGEMILNAGQQRNLFDSINSGTFGRGDQRIQVFNQAANDVSAEPAITEDGIKLMIRRTVAKDMAEGRFNRSYKTMQGGLRGTRYTN
jgi:hypothetical protein